MQKWLVLLVISCVRCSYRIHKLHVVEIIAVRYWNFRPLLKKFSTFHRECWQDQIIVLFIINIINKLFPATRSSSNCVSPPHVLVRDKESMRASSPVASSSQIIQSQRRVRFLKSFQQWKCSTCILSVGWIVARDLPLYEGCLPMGGIKISTTPTDWPTYCCMEW